MDHGRIVKRALEITWRHKVLWVFGIVAALFGVESSGGGGRWNGLQYVLSPRDVQRWQRGLPFGPRLPYRPGPPMPGWIEQGVPMVLGILAILAFFALALLVIGIIARYTSLGALAGMVDEIETREHTSFRSGLGKGWSRMLRLLAIDLLIGIGVFIILIPVIVVFVLGIAVAVGPAMVLARDRSGLMVLGIVWGIGVGLAVILLMILVAFVFSALVTIVREFAFRACVLDRQGVFDALRGAVALMRERLREALLMWLLLVGIRLVLGLVTVPLVLMGVGMTVVPALLAYRVAESFVAALVVAVPLLVVMILLGVVVGGIYLTFISAVWTLSYRELRGKQLLAEAA